jgi:hypothetical protein
MMKDSRELRLGSELVHRSVHKARSLMDWRTFLHSQGNDFIVQKILIGQLDGQIGE